MVSAPPIGFSFASHPHCARGQPGARLKAPPRAGYKTVSRCFCGFYNEDVVSQENDAETVREIA